MFGRVVVRRIAALLLFSPALFGGGTEAFADENSAAVTAPQQAEIRVSDKSPDRIENLIQRNSHTPADAALDPKEEGIDSPPLGAAAAIRSFGFAEPFGLDTIPVANGEIFTKWSSVAADIRSDNEVIALCQASIELCPEAAQNFLAIVALGQAKTGRARIGIINRAINLAIRPMSDLAQWGVIDHWSPPLATLTSGRGDCEDYAIAKYVALQQAGVAAADLRLVIVRDFAVGEDHAVVAARLDGDWIVLDNRWLTLVKDSELHWMVPLFALDQTGVRQFTRSTSPQPRRVTASAAG